MVFGEYKTIKRTAGCFLYTCFTACGGEYLADFSNYIIGGILDWAAVMLLIAKFTSRLLAPTLTRKQRRNLQDVSDYVQNVVKSKKVGVCRASANATLGLLDVDRNQKLDCDRCWEGLASLL
ncbi:hypothetical protein BaRGS_00025346 [Batillaria attramentaria]|uniref:Uncharacterized protein n=1 Tax=Batillaria attramentaria TaxID=370345 RepID=A0ABD0K8J4_9CAEN